MATDNEQGAKVLTAVRRLFPDVDQSGAFTLDDYVHSRGRASEALLYSALFCPLLSEVEGSVLLQRAVEDESARERFVTCRAREGKGAAERSFNFAEVPYLFGPSGRDTTDEEDQVLAETLASSWRGCLCARYPGRSFLVEVLEPEQAGGVVAVHFWETTAEPTGGQRERLVDG